MSNGESRYETREVLAGAYKGRNVKRFIDLLTHTVRLQQGAEFVGEQVLCRRVRPENLADQYANPPGLDQPPTCPVCFARDPRFETTVCPTHGTTHLARAGCPICYEEERTS